jgi:uncharacterized protein (DUF3084 family)
MTSGYILIAAMLVLGALIAVLGDRLGTKVGKARLRLFNLRPRETAVLVTVVTGILISASTLGILFATSKSLRQGIFELDDILNKRRKVKAELDRANQEKLKVENELSNAKIKEFQAKLGLNKVAHDFKKAQTQLKVISQQGLKLRSEVKKLLNERQKLIEQKSELSQRIKNVKQEIDLLQTQLQERDRKLTRKDLELANSDRALKNKNQELFARDRELQNRDRQLTALDEKLVKQNQELTIRDRALKQKEQQLKTLEQQQNILQTKINEQDEKINNLDLAIATKDRDLQTRENKLKELEQQLEFVKKEVDILEEYYQTYQDLRGRQIALVRGQVLAIGAVRILKPEAASEAIDELLRQANRKAIEATDINNNNNFERRVVQITQAQFEVVKERLKDGKDYVVRIICAGNYVRGEKEVRVFADVVTNQKLFNRGDAIAAVSIDENHKSESELQKQLDSLLSETQFRARQVGILGEIQIEDGKIVTLVDFYRKLKESPESFGEIQVIVLQDTYTLGPLKIRLIAIKDGKPVIST